MTDIPTRRPCITEVIDFPPFKDRICLTVSFMPDKRAKDLCGTPIEVFFTARGKSGTGVEEFLYEAGVTASKLMQKDFRNET
ncbi:MAG: hypothetical protein H8E94_00210 [Alphaproteobacteria bacterium]|nr:hypothetical protein [Alphaproteobacteria bacterium]